LYSLAAIGVNGAEPLVLLPEIYYRKCGDLNINEPNNNALGG
jgi:hypothetical protein